MPRYLGAGGVSTVTGAPGAGTNAVQTLTIGGTPTGGTFVVTYEGFTTAAITWSSTNGTLLSNINTALDALPNVPDSGIVATAGTLTAGIGTILLTFSGGNQARSVRSLAVATSSLTGSAPTTVIATTTPGVDATARDAARGHILVRTDAGTMFVNTSATPFAPTWTAQV